MNDLQKDKDDGWKYADTRMTLKTLKKNWKVKIM